ncbi:hypothetical protein L2E82_19489 [Cichorium intybus]|uniref:Uncharacterized protein n=1 Tax=Cichorium intybus TaxID=13427 RepID=A0ACB9FBJ1_CICIN|nr:hypothetical protein L2E82_19489 [Cichorium intybus]
MIRSCSPLNLDIISQQQKYGFLTEEGSWKCIWGYVDSGGRSERLPVVGTRTTAQFIEYRAPDPYYAPPYGVPPPLSQQYGEYKEEKKSKYGMGTVLAVGAAAGLLGRLAIAEGVDYV